MSGRQAILVASAGLAIIAAAVLYMLRGPGTSSLTPVIVRLKWLHQAQFAGFYTAAERGYYREEGLSVALNPGGVDFPAVQMVAGSGEDFGITGADQLILAREKGVPVVAVAVLYRTSPMVYFALKETGITKPQDFIGKRVGVKLGGNEELTYRALLRRLGIDPSLITEVAVKYDMTPLLTGQVDVWPGYAINEPLVAQEKGFEVNLIWPPDYGVTLYADTLFTTEAMLEQQPEVVRRFVRATLKGWQYAVEHPDEAVEFTLRNGKHLDRQHEHRMLEASILLVKPDDSPIGTMDRERWMQMHDLLLEHGFLHHPVAVEHVFTTRFGEGN